MLGNCIELVLHCGYRTSHLELAILSCILTFEDLNIRIGKTEINSPDTFCDQNNKKQTFVGYFILSKFFLWFSS